MRPAAHRLPAVQHPPARLILPQSARTLLAVSFSISILVLVSICIRVFPIIGLLVLLVLAWGLVNGMLLIMMYKLKNAKSDRIWIPEAA